MAETDGDAVEIGELQDPEPGRKPGELRPSWRGRRQPGQPDKRPPNMQKFGWQPGKSGNPAGPGKGWINWSKKLKDYLEGHPHLQEAIVARWVQDAVNGVPGARESLCDRCDGKVFALPTVGEGEVQAVRITTVEIVAQAEPGEKMIPYRQVVIDSPPGGNKQEGQT